MATAPKTEPVTALALVGEPETALVEIKQLTPTELFKPETMGSIIDRLKAHVRSTRRDISTDKGRKAIKSVVRDIQSSRAFVEEQRIALVGEEKKKLGLIDAEGKRFRDEMEALWKEFRAPLTAWEDAEKDRCAENERRIALISHISVTAFVKLSSIDLAEKDLDALWNHNFQEFTERASEAREKSALYLKSERERLTREESERVERARLKAEADEKARIEREAKIAEDARLGAEAEAKRREKAQADAAAAREAELVRVAAEDKARVERERIESEERLKKSLVDEKAKAQERERVAETVRNAARERAEAEREAAVKEERRRQEAIREGEERQRKEAEAEKQRREADKAHRQKVLTEAFDVLVAQVPALTSDCARAVIRAIAKGVIPNVSINY